MLIFIFLPMKKLSFITFCQFSLVFYATNVVKCISANVSFEILLPISRKIIIKTREKNMKIKTVEKSYDEVMALPNPKKFKPRRASILFRTLVRVISSIDLWKARFTHTGKLPPKEEGPFLILMNHSSFIDLKIAHKLIYPRHFGIVCAHDALVGKRLLMSLLGCIPTKKFVSDLSLIHNMKHFLDKGINVLMYPEAGYSFDGRSTVIPEHLGSLVKMLKVPVVYIGTKGAFTRDPLYNELKVRKVPVSADVQYLFTREDVERLSAAEMDERIKLAFTFDGFAWQRENGIRVTESFRADGLERILYRCAHCEAEGFMKGEGTTLTCEKCGKSYTLTELGELDAKDGETRFSHIPDWYEWQRQCVRQELLEERYTLEVPVDIGIMFDYKALYKVGRGVLSHTLEGFHLKGCDGKLDYSQKARSSYGLNADYYWYEIGDVICIGNSQRLYYCFPPKDVPVAKTRLATEELYKLHQDHEFHLKHCSECDHPAHSARKAPAAT